MSPTKAGAADLNSKQTLGFYELGLHGGAFIPNRIAPLIDVMKSWGLRLGFPTDRGNFEIDYLTARADGRFFDDLSLDYRFDFVNDISPIHALLGMHIDTWSIEDGVGKFGGGWHIAGGNTVLLAGSVYFRSDFKYRFGPGTSLDASIGILYRFASTQKK
jgi:hypothetical protein